MRCKFKVAAVLVLTSLSLSNAVVIADENNKSLANNSQMSKNLIAPRMRAKRHNVRLSKGVDERNVQLHKSLINKFSLAENSSKNKYKRYRQHYRFSRNNNKHCEATIIKSRTVGRVTTTIEEKVCTIE